MARRLSSPVLIGRGEQLQTLRAALQQTEGGEPTAVFIAGESGVGKTRLVTEFERVALAAGARFLIGGCVDVGGAELPYAPLLGALRILVADVAPDALQEMVGTAAGELGRLLPELAAGAETAETGGHGADPLAQSRLFEGLLGVLGRAGREAPVVLVIEDLHWADPSTLGFLSFLLRNVRRERLMLVATYRSDELHRRHPLRRFLAETERLAAVERVSVAPFTRHELAEQLSEILEDAPAPEVVEQLYARSQGNAFFTEELLAVTAEGQALEGRALPIPASVRDAVMIRVERVSAETRSVLRRAAVLGTGVGHRLLAAVTQLEDEALIAALREAIEHNVLVPDASGTSYAFRHALLREALYEELLPHERTTLHAILARALEQDPSLAVGPPGAAAQRATHWAAAHEVVPALSASVQAGIEDERIWAFAEATAHFEHAIELWERVPAEARPAGVSLPGLLARAAEAAHLSGDNRRAQALARSELGMLDPDKDPVAVGMAHARLGRYLLAEEGAASAALAEHQAAAALLPDEPTAIRASILAGEAHILMLRGQGLDARAPCEEAIRIARAVGDRDVECDALNTLGAIFVILGARSEATELLREAMRLAEQLGALEQLRRAYINLGEVLDQSGRLPEAAELARTGWERLRQPLGSSALFLAAEAGLRLVRLGQWEAADALLRDAVEPSRPTPFAGMVLAALVELAALRGDLAEAEAALRAATPLLPRHTDWTIVHGRAAAALAVARGEYEEVRPLLGPDLLTVEDGHLVFAIPMLACALWAEAEIACRARASGQPVAEQEAVTHAEGLLERVRSLSEPGAWPLGAAPPEALLGIELCELELRRARGESDVERWAALAAGWEPLGNPFNVAYARLREAEAALVEQLPRARIAAALGSARGIASRLGAAPLLEQIELLARRARVRGDSPGRGGDPAGLTDRELDVLHLLVRGHTNREIGQELYMSPKTASVHVSRILAKLEVRTRTEAAGAAYRLGLLDDGRRDGRHVV